MTVKDYVTWLYFDDIFFAHFRKFNYCKLEIQGRIILNLALEWRNRRANSAARFRRFRANRSRHVTRAQPRERCIDGDAFPGACAARPMHVVSASMSRRDLNFPTLGAPSLPPRHSPRPVLCPLHRSYSMQLLPFPPRAARHPTPYPRPIGCVRVHLPAPSRTTRAPAYAHASQSARARMCVCDTFSLGM